MIEDGVDLLVVAYEDSCILPDGRKEELQEVLVSRSKDGKLVIVEQDSETIVLSMRQLTEIVPAMLKAMVPVE